MRYIYIILICFLSVATQAQVQKQPRSNFPTVVDSSLAIGKNFIIPVFRSLSDLAKYQVLDSSGRLMFLRDSNAVFFRNNAHQWVKLATSGGSSGGGWQLTGNAIASGEFFGTTNNQPLDIRADGVTLMLLDGNTKIVTIGDVDTTASGATLIVDATDNGSYNFNKPYFTINGVEYVFPSVQGSPLSVLTNNGSGVLQWVAPDTVSDRLISVVLSLIDSTLTITTPVFISGGQIDSIPGSFSYVIHSVDSGYIRQTTFFVDNGTSIDSLQGVADTMNIAPPAVPVGGIGITIVTQIGDIILQPTPSIISNYWTTDKPNFIPSTQQAIIGVQNGRSFRLVQGNLEKARLDSTGGFLIEDSLVISEINTLPAVESDSRSIILRGKGSTGNLQEGVILYDGNGGVNGGAIDIRNRNGFIRWTSSTGEYQLIGNARVGGSTSVDMFNRSTTLGQSISNDSKMTIGTLLKIRDYGTTNYREYVNVNYDGRIVQQDSISSAPDASAMYDMRSTTKGFLKPRMSGAQMNAIASPATGLEVYNTDSAATCYYNGSAWVKVGSGGGSSGNDTLTLLPPLYGTVTGDTAYMSQASEDSSGWVSTSQVILWNNAALNTWKLDGNSGTDPSINFLGTTDHQPILFKVDNGDAGWIDVDDANVSLGNGAMSYTNYVSIPFTHASAFGAGSLTGNQGSDNTGIGYASGSGNSTGQFNTFIGSNSGVLTDGLSNTSAIGYSAKAGVSNSTIIGDSLVNLFTGIGTSYPQAKLHVVGNGTNTAVFMNGNVGIGTTTPDSMLTNELGLYSKRGVRFSGLIQSGFDTSTYKPVVVNSSGILSKMNWPASSSVTLASGTYTPTATIVANLDATPTLSVCQYLRVGNTVTVSGEITVDPTTASGTLTRARFTLPIASALTISAQCSGNANIGIAGTVALGAAIKGDATNDQAEIAFGATYTSSLTYNFSFTYQVL